MNVDDNLFLTIKCRKCRTNYVFWRDMRVNEVEIYLKEHTICEVDAVFCRPHGIFGVFD